MAKRRKRSLEGLSGVEGVRVLWRLLREPQWTTEHGFKGLCISVRTEDARHRELVLEYPMPNKQIPQRPKFSVKTIDDGIRQAIAARITRKGLRFQSLLKFQTEALPAPPSISTSTVQSVSVFCLPFAAPRLRIDTERTRVA